MSLDNLVEEDEDEDNGIANNDGRSKSRIAFTISGKYDSSDSYDDYTDWSQSEEDMKLAYLVTKGKNNTGTEGMVRDSAEKIADSGNHNEWYSELQVKLAHFFGDFIGVDLPDGREPKGAAPLLEYLDIRGEHIVDYFKENPEVRENFKEALKEANKNDEDDSTSAPASPVQGDD